MTRLLFIISIACMISCKRESAPDALNDSGVELRALDSVPELPTEIRPDTTSTAMAPSNERFRNVRVDKVGDGQYIVSGQARVFEATLSYVVEDGHNELASGFSTSDAGAPEWGNFSFALEVKKDRPESTLHLILFESSPKDGARTHELPVRLMD